MDRQQIYTAYMYSYPHKTAYGKIRVERAEIEECFREREMNLYIHLPFCESKCGYCNLFSVTGLSRADYARYLTAMEVQARQYGLDQRTVNWKSLTIGGGTPMILDPELLERLFLLADQAGALEAYSCIETSPNQTTREKAGILKKNRIDRVSIGIQSFSDRELAELGRRHSVKAAAKALEILKAAEFPCLNLDLIYGMESQTKQSLMDSLQAALSYQPEELFVYPLYIRKGTGMYGRAQVRHEETYEYYWLIRDCLLSRGYHQLSMRRFVRHQPEYTSGCAFDATLSLGCGGRSYLGDIHCCTPYAINRRDCLELLNGFMDAGDKTGIYFGYRLNADEHKRRYAIKNLLHASGVDLAEYRQVFGEQLTEAFPFLEELSDRSYIEHKDGRMQLTALGMSLSDYIGPLFISPEVRAKMDRWWQK